MRWTTKSWSGDITTTLSYQPTGSEVKYFGDDPPTLSRIARNVSLILVNSHFSLNTLRPTLPTAVEVGSLHIQSPNKLPQVCTLHRDCFIHSG